MNLDSQNVNVFIADIGSRYDAYFRNKVWDVAAGKERIIPVSENAKFRNELQDAIDDLCVFYVTCSDEIRDEIRKLVDPYRSLRSGLLGHIGWVAKRIHSSQDSDWVQRALAAASILDCREDIRDLYRSLGDLYIQAVRVDIDASAFFKAAGELSSSTVGRLYGFSTRDFLAGFDQSSYFKGIQYKLPNRFSGSLPD